MAAGRPSPFLGRGNKSLKRQQAASKQSQLILLNDLLVAQPPPTGGRRNNNERLDDPRPVHLSRAASRFYQNETWSQVDTLTGPTEGTRDNIFFRTDHRVLMLTRKQQEMARFMLRPPTCRVPASPMAAALL